MSGLIEAASKPLVDTKFVPVNASHALVKVFFSILGPVRSYELTLLGLNVFEEQDYVAHQPNHKYTGHVKVLEVARALRTLLATHAEEERVSEIFEGRALMPRKIDAGRVGVAVMVDPDFYTGKKALVRTDS